MTAVSNNEETAREGSHRETSPDQLPDRPDSGDAERLHRQYQPRSEIVQKVRNEASSRECRQVTDEQ